MLDRILSCGRSLIVLTPMVLAMAACYLAKEFYPLSSFPMYSKFDDRTYLAYVKSAEGNPLATVPTFHLVASAELKKAYGNELEKLKKQYKGSHFDWSVEQKRAAGEATLAYLRDTRSPEAFKDDKLAGLQLVDLRIFLVNGKLTTSEEVVAQLPVR